MKTNFFDWANIGEVYRIVPRSLQTREITKIFNHGQKIFFLKSYITPLYLIKLVFPKFDPLTVTGMNLCVDVGPNVKIYSA
jgi:hypothetical protein